LIIQKPTMTTTLKIDFVSDIACPWCAVGLGALEQALDSLQGEVKADIRFQPFELNPNLAEGGQDLFEHLNQKYGSSAEQQAQMYQNIKARGAEVPIPSDVVVAKAFSATASATGSASASASASAPASATGTASASATATAIATASALPTASAAATPSGTAMSMHSAASFRVLPIAVCRVSSCHTELVGSPQYQRIDGDWNVERLLPELNEMRTATSTGASDQTM
jgi:hypothetical protein